LDGKNHLTENDPIDIHRAIYIFGDNHIQLITEARKGQKAPKTNIKTFPRKVEADFIANVGSNQGYILEIDLGPLINKILEVD
jgi:hypothetical protein